MNILVYTTLANNAFQHLIQTIEKVARGERTEIFNKPESLIDRLIQIRKDGTIVILLITNQIDLSLVLSFGSFFEDYKLILILPDRNKQTVSKGHQLCPRYVSFADGDFSDVGAVLNKMISNMRDAGNPPPQASKSVEPDKPEGCLA